MIRINSFRGMRPRADARLLEANQAQTAQNCVLTSGKLRPLRQPLLETTLTKPGTIQSIYLFAGTYWFHWAADVDVVKGQIPTDTTERTYWTGDGYPKVTNAAIALSGGGTNYPINHYRLGIPAPASSPGVSIPAHGQPIDAEQFEVHRWVFTFVSGWGEEGPPSPASSGLTRNYLTAGGLEPVDITMGAVPTGPYNLVLRRLYRTNTASDGSAIWQLVAELPVATTSYQDTTANDNLSITVLPSIEWDMPPETLKGLVNMPNGMTAGFVGFDVYFGEAFQPHAWPTKYIQPCDYPIVGLGVFGTTLVVCTEGHPYIGTGSDPESILLSKIALPQACVSKRSIAQMGLEGIVYASPDGLVLIGPSSAGVVTEALFSREEWQAFNPSSITAFHHDGAYIAFYDTGTTEGCLILDPGMDGVTVADIHATGGHVNLINDALYVVRSNNQVQRWDAGALMTALWKSGRQVLGLTNPPAAKVVADTYPVTFKLYADGALKHTQAVASARPFRLPGGYLASEWEVEVSGTAQVNEIRVGSMESLR